MNPVCPVRTSMKIITGTSDSSKSEVCRRDVNNTYMKRIACVRHISSTILRFTGITGTCNGFHWNLSGNPGSTGPCSVYDFLNVLVCS